MSDWEYELEDYLDSLQEDEYNSTSNELYNPRNEI